MYNDDWYTKDNSNDVAVAMLTPAQQKKLNEDIDAIKASQVATTGGRKFDGDKTEYGLLPALALEEIAKVLTFGAQKYERDNWKRVPDSKRRYFDALQRHLWAWKRGEKFDYKFYLYDLPEFDTSLIDAIVAAIKERYDAGDEPGMYGEWESITDNEVRIRVWDTLKPDSKVRSAIKAYKEKMKEST